MANDKWLGVGAIKVSKGGKKYLAFGNPTSKYEPLNVEVIVKDANGNVLAKVSNPSFTIQNPRTRVGATEDQIAKIPEWLVANVSLGPDRPKE